VEPIVAVLRRFAVDFFTAHNLSVCAEIMTPDYQLTVGRTIIAGRDQHYLPAVEQQLSQFPGLAMTVHDVVVTPTRAALYFSEHGASGGPGGPCASWSGVALYEFDGVQLTRCFANEDYQARRRQLKSGTADTVRPPAVAPWDVAVGQSNPAAEAIVSEWLSGAHALTDSTIDYDDESMTTASTPFHFKVISAEVISMFSSNERVAFAVMHQGTYQSGSAEIFSTGMVTVKGDQVASGSVIRDRAALFRAVQS
jgi:hypothetical protein